MKPAYTILGPCRCIGCGTTVYYAHSLTRDGWNGPAIKGFLKWREAGGRVHRCATLTPTVMPSSKRRSGSGLITRPRPAA